jgi:hypothetical protein
MSSAAGAIIGGAAGALWRTVVRKKDGRVNYRWCRWQAGYFNW